MGTGVGIGMETVVESSEFKKVAEVPFLLVRLLGPLTVNRSGAPVELPASRKVRALFAYLAVAPSAVSRSHLCEMFWDAPNDPRSELRWCLSKIRSVTGGPGASRVETATDRLRLNLSGCIVDALEIAGAAKAGFKTATTEQLTNLEAMFTGDFLAGMELDRAPVFDTWLAAQRRQFRSWHANLLERLVESDQGQNTQLYLDKWLELAPFDLHAHERLLDALALRNQIREGDEHLAAAVQLFKAEGLESAPLYEAWRSARAQAIATLAPGPTSSNPSSAPLPLPIKPSIVVLPFTSMSSEQEDELFADGLTEDLITDLSRNAGLFVIARHSVFAYKGRSMDVRRISQELGVRYVLEGSARRVAGRVRISAQLIDADTGRHLWAERFDRELESVFAVQDEVTDSIVGALAARLTSAAPRQRPRSVEAHDLCARARILTEETPQSAREACLMLRRATELDPTYAEAHGLLAYNRWLAWTHFGEPEDLNRSLAVELAERAVALDPNDAGCRYFLGTILAYEKRWEESDAQFGAALELDPNHADTWAALSDMSILSGRISEGVEQIQKAFRLNPYPAVWYYDHLGQAQYAAQDYESAVETLRREETYRTNSRKFLAASLAQLGHFDEAQRETEMFLATHPHFTIRHWVNSQPLRDKAVHDHFVEGFRKAKLPE
jgi:TolB-like protein/DNA-binding SARP family transcriptional activator/Tfp pilus assembly protein PilF